MLWHKSLKVFEYQLVTRVGSILTKLIISY